MKKAHWIFFLIGLVMIGSTAGFLFHVKGNQRLGPPGVLLGNTPLFDENTNRVADVTVILPEEVQHILAHVLLVQTGPGHLAVGQKRAE